MSILSSVSKPPWPHTPNLQYGLQPLPGHGQNGTLSSPPQMPTCLQYKLYALSFKLVLSLLTIYLVYLLLPEPAPQAMPMAWARITALNLLEEYPALSISQAYNLTTF